MKKSSVFTVFWALIGVFLVVGAQLFIEPFGDIFRGTLFFLLPMIVFSFLGFLLLIATLKMKPPLEKILKNFLLLTSSSAIGFFVFNVLHNFFYGLGIVVKNIVSLNYLMEILHVASFLIAIFACPLGFLAGVVGTVVFLLRKKPASR